MTFPVLANDYRNKIQSFVMSRLPTAHVRWFKFACIFISHQGALAPGKLIKAKIKSKCSINYDRAFRTSKCTCCHRVHLQDEFRLDSHESGTLLLLGHGYHELDIRNIQMARSFPIWVHRVTYWVHIEWAHRRKKITNERAAWIDRNGEDYKH